MRKSKIEKRIHPKLYSSLEFDEFRPCQEKAIDAGLLERKNLLVCTPTASGKTLVAEIGAVNSILEKKGKAVYIVPLKSLAMEKYKEFKESYEGLGVKVALSIGDLDSTDGWLETYDLIIVTAEKLDSLLRHRARWVKDVATVVVDEVHLINDVSRGPTLEVLITLLRKVLPKMQLIALSATIGNPEELAEWMDAEVVLDGWRPVRLYQGTFFDEFIDFHGERKKHDIVVDISDPTLQLAIDTIKSNQQALIFCPTKAIAESTAMKIAALQKIDEDLRADAEKVVKVLQRPTQQCQKLFDVFLKGVAFHHAGLVAKQKTIVENNFREGNIKVICCTPTLCLHSHTHIWRNLNKTTVKDLISNDEVLSLNKNKIELTNVLRLNAMEAPNELIQITSNCGHSIQLTPNHTILVKRDGEKEELSAREIVRGDKIATIGKIEIKSKEVKWSDFVKDNSLPFKDGILSEDAFYLIGAMLGDGHSGAELIHNKIEYKGSPSIVGRDKEIFNIVKKVCTAHGIHYRETKNSWGVPQLILSKANWFREFLVRCGVDLGLNKNINAKLKSASKEKIGCLIQGLLDTDGYVECAGKIGFSNISINLVSDLQQCLLRWGILTRIRTRKGSSMKVKNKEYKTKQYYELTILQRESINEFASKINFNLSRKQQMLQDLLNQFNQNLLEIRCDCCGYKLNMNIFEGRTKEQKNWAKKKVEIINCLGKNRELSSKELTKRLGYIPRKKEKRLNHHYDLISKRRVGNRSKTEWFWKLNNIGNYVFEQVLQKNIPLKQYFLDINTCPLCNTTLIKELRGTWRQFDIDGDIFWDIVKETKIITSDVKEVYDVVLDTPEERFFVAEGFLVHNSMGINMPADRTIMKSLKRFDGRGSSWIPVLEYHQMTGRAGRPGRGVDEGLAISIAGSEKDEEYIYERYILGQPEDIESKLSVEPLLRTHMLSLIASGFTKTKKELMEFFKRTFYGSQYGDDWGFELKIEDILERLEKYRFITSKDDQLRPTKLGKRISELYLDPQDAWLMITGLKKVSSKNEFSIAHLISSTSEMWPRLSARKSDGELIDDAFVNYERFIITDIPKEWDWDYPKFLDAIKTSLLFIDWMNEHSEEYLLEKYAIRPGEVRSKMLTADWLLYACSEISRLLNLKDEQSLANKTRLRVKHGIKEELMALVKLKQIGRYRARLLWNAGWKHPRDIKKSTPAKLATILHSAKIADKVWKQLKDKNKESGEF